MDGVLFYSHGQQYPKSWWWNPKLSFFRNVKSVSSKLISYLSSCTKMFPKISSEARGEALFSKTATLHQSVYEKGTRHCFPGKFVKYSRTVLDPFNVSLEFNKRTKLAQSWKKRHLKNKKNFKVSQPAITCLKSTIETLE